MGAAEAARDDRRRDNHYDDLLRITLEQHNPVCMHFETAAIEGGMIYRVERSLSLSAEFARESFEDRVRWWVEDERSTEVLLERDSKQGAALILLQRQTTGPLEIGIAAPELKSARAISEEFVRRFGRDKKDAGNERVCVSFWRDGAPRPDSNDRFLDAVRWKDISGNYHAATHKKLGHVMSLDSRKLEGGRLLLWHGKPGTGKTYALRALAYEWKEWCDVYYITDPESLFGRASYLLHLMIQEDTGDDERWRLLVMEDTGELLSIDARQNVGQALSRLLNVTEGLLGQGLRVLFLITTNEELGKLNLAVTRPGRCLSAIEFAPFTHDEARAWLARTGTTAEPKGPMTLSELYALTRGELPQPRASVGFVPN